MVYNAISEEHILFQSEKFQTFSQIIKRLKFSQRWIAHISQSWEIYIFQINSEQAEIKMTKFKLNLAQMKINLTKYRINLAIFERISRSDI